MLILIIILIADASGLNLTTPVLLTSRRSFEKNVDLIYETPFLEGRVRFQATKGHGIMVVVQKMDLLTQSSESPCIDSITISNQNGSKSLGPICGISNRRKGGVGFKPAFLDKNGDIQISYKLTEKLQLRQPLEDGPPILNFNISITPFIECPDDAFPYGNREYRPCSTFDPFSCIPAEYFCDGVVNCGFDREVGLDEVFCPQIDDDQVNKNDNDLLKIIKKPYNPYIRQMDELPPNFRSRDEYPDYEMEFVGFKDPRDGFPITLILFIAIGLALLIVGRLSSKNKRPEVVVVESDVEIGPARPDFSDSINNSNSKFENYAFIKQEFTTEEPAPPYESCLTFSTSRLHYESETPPSYDEVSKLVPTN